MSSWNDANRVVYADPRPGEGFVVVLVEGKQAVLTTVDHYDAVLAKALELAKSTKLAIKVLPMKPQEYLNYAGVSDVEPFKSPAEEAECKQWIANNLREIIIDAPDRSTRVEARDLLLKLGEAVC